MLVHLGKLYAETEQKQFALEILQKVITIEEETLGEENERYKKNLKVLAKVSYTLANYELSMQCWEKLYNMNFEETPEKRFESAKMEIWLASCCLQMDNISKAKAYYEKAMEKKENCGVLPDKEWGLMIKTFLLALAKKNEQKIHMEKMKQLEQTEQKCKKQKRELSFEEQEKDLLYCYEQNILKFGENDIYTLEYCIKLGDFYGEAGMYDKAFVWLDRAEKQGEGEIYAQALRKIAILYLLTKNYEKAFEKLTHAIQYQETYGSEKGEEYCILMGLMGDFYFAIKNIEQSFHYYEIWHKLFGGKIFKNQLYLERIQRMGAVLEKMKKREIANTYYKEAVKYIKKEQGESLALARALLKLGENLLKLDKKSEEGQKYIEQAISIFETEKGKQSKSYGKLMSKLGNLYVLLGKTEQGIAFLEQCYQIQCDYEESKILSKKGYETLLKYLKENKYTEKYQLMKQRKPLY